MPAREENKENEMKEYVKGAEEEHTLEYLQVTAVRL
jgi:hypothetical protein